MRSTVSAIASPVNTNREGMIRSALEIPTPRWTAYDAKYFKVKMPQEVPMITQERAYTSPIWYTPEA